VALEPNYTVEGLPGVTHEKLMGHASNPSQRGQGKVFDALK
jgi:hypothetical protein